MGSGRGAFTSRIARSKSTTARPFANRATRNGILADAALNDDTYPVRDSASVGPANNALNATRSGSLPPSTLTIRAGTAGTSGPWRGAQPKYTVAVAPPPSERGGAKPHFEGALATYTETANACRSSADCFGQLGEAAVPAVSAGTVAVPVFALSSAGAGVFNAVESARAGGSRTHALTTESAQPTRMIGLNAILISRLQADSAAVTTAGHRKSAFVSAPSGKTRRSIGRFSRAGPILLERVEVVEAAQEEQIGNLFDDLQRIGDAAGPEGIPDLVDLALDGAGDHVAALRFGSSEVILALSARGMGNLCDSALATVWHRKSAHQLQRLLGGRGESLSTSAIYSFWRRTRVPINGPIHTASVAHVWNLSRVI